LKNLLDKWGSIKRRHIATKSSAVDTLQNQFSGYGSRSAVVARTLDRMGMKEPLEQWSDEPVEKVVNAFIDERFPTVIALNKIDHEDSSQNITKIAKAQPAESIVLTSAISEVFLRRLTKQGYVVYTEGTEFVDTREDLIDNGDPEGGGLKLMDERLKERLESLRDLVLFRFGSTGVSDVLSRVAKLLGLTPVFLTKHLNFATSNDAKVFRDCVLVKKGSTVGDVFKKAMGDVPLAYAEAFNSSLNAVRVSEDEIVAVGKNDVRSLTQTHTDANTHRFYPSKSVVRDKSHVCPFGRALSNCNP
jgi:ribosome-binding ATPase YchF (GTP1/OBG family)